MSDINDDGCEICDLCGEMFLECTCVVEELQKVFNENIPEEVLLDNWEPKYLPDLEQLL